MLLVCLKGRRKVNLERVVDSLEIYGLEKKLVDACGDWGLSDTGTLHVAVFEMRKKGHKEGISKLSFTIIRIIPSGKTRSTNLSPHFKGRSVDAIECSV